MLNEENFFVPFETSQIPGGPWLIFSPHADDETFGMGGALVKASDRGTQTHLVVLTDGALGGQEPNLALIREREVKEACNVLGVASLDCWMERDRGLILKNELVTKIVKKIRDICPAAVFFPGPMEPHPDHRNASLLVWAALQAIPEEERPRSYSYEISVQNPVNLLIDISKEYKEKSLAMSIYSSQLGQNNYEDLVRALDKARTFSLPKQIEFAEGFYCYSDMQLKNTLPQVLTDIVSSYLKQLHS